MKRSAMPGGVHPLRDTSASCCARYPACVDSKWTRRSTPPTDNVSGINHARQTSVKTTREMPLTLREEILVRRSGTTKIENCGRHPTARAANAPDHGGGTYNAAARSASAPGSEIGRVECTSRVGEK